MSENLITSLEITVVGMGLVFGAILLLWLVMALLVRFTTEREPEPTGPNADEIEMRRRAAVAAVAVALARQIDDTQPHAFPLPPTAAVSPWQAVMRGRHLKQRRPL
ncbi:MAG: OadG family protein [Anaerolineae bacterium]|jgi:Na+-transporting methylmalonyl-CoA/oxaloacetate decarboxylase gamma subunit|nr:OadG family protein [Anaerolineae bacterium]